MYENEIVDLDGNFITIHEFDENAKCKECKHAYYVYGVEFNCERLNKGKRCSFKKEERYHEK